MQLELSLYRPGTLGEAVYWSLRHTCDHVQPATLKDYGERARWLMRIFGGDTELARIGYTRLLEVSKDHGPRGKQDDKLLNTTIKKRFVFLHKVISEAHGRGLVPTVPMFPKLRNDGRARKRIHTYEQFKLMRSKLPLEWQQTWVTCGWFCGMRSFDLNRMRESWFRLDEPYRDNWAQVTYPGRWLRHSHKNDPHDDDLVWLPMEADFVDWMASRTTKSGPQQRITGVFHKAAAAMAAACERAGVPRISPIDLRRSRASLLAAEGRSDEYVRVWLGHRGQTLRSQADDGTVMVTAGRPTIRHTHYYRPMGGG